MDNNPSGRTQKEQQQHDQILLKLAEYLHKKGYLVFADGVSWIKGSPPRIGAHVPDIVATNKHKKVIIEVETQSTYDNVRTHAQLMAFSHVPGYDCYCFVPTQSNDKPEPAVGLELKLSLWQLRNVKVRRYAGDIIDYSDF